MRRIESDIGLCYVSAQSVDIMKSEHCLWVRNDDETWGDIEYKDEYVTRSYAYKFLDVQGTKANCRLLYKCRDHHRKISINVSHSSHNMFNMVVAKSS